MSDYGHAIQQEHQPQPEVEMTATVGIVGTA